ncbi:hypothetical protein BB560_006885 [Smittium megazygosporum]|uniref:Enoyl reductase (ER) domain-containing protein n=1 Tax=Smittium megazygosporum TaxID=133381 RepID=A0A2T9Y0M1_9FUNG|nr:hypothetical protein BB560_006885 [Smittium megazygosporum]
MQAIVVKSVLTSPREMTVSRVPIPEPGPGQVLVHVRAVGANFFDILMIQRKYQHKPPMPYIPGREFAGVVVRTHHTAKKFEIGETVFGSVMNGAYAEYVCVDETAILRIPSNISFEQAAGIHITYPTSYTALVHRADLKSSETVLVLAAAGGVGLAAVQIAKALGAKVIAAVGSKDKFDICIKYGGADHVINYRDEDWTQQVLSLTSGRGVDVVYDPVGLIETSLKCIAWNGRALIVGFAGGNIEKIASNRILLKNVSVAGFVWGSYAKNAPNLIPKIWSGIFELIESENLVPLVYKQVFVGLENTYKALDVITSRASSGKVVVVPSKSSPKL